MSVGGVPGRARQGACRPRPARFDQRPNLTSQINAAEAQFLVHWIARRQARRIRVQRQQFFLRDAEHRAQMPAPPECFAHRHGRQSLEPSAAQSLQQKRRGLIVEVMGSQQAFPREQLGFERAIAGFARRGFNRRAATGGDDRRNDRERNIQPPAEGGARFAKFGGGGLQTVVHMNRSQRHLPAQGPPGGRGGE